MHVITLTYPDGRVITWSRPEGWTAVERNWRRKLYGQDGVTVEFTDN